MGLARWLILSGVIGTTPVLAQGAPAKSHGFNLFGRVASSYAIYRPNRTDCGVVPEEIGGVANDIYFGCVWPTGTPNNYIFASGFRLAGIIGPEVSAWAGDTSGSFIFDLKGTTPHVGRLTPVWSSRNDAAKWPAAARVPAGGLYLPDAVGKVAASNEDVWSMVWDDPTALAGRSHPLGIALETRLLGWSYPRGNEDIMYLNFSIYNISATNPAAYAGVRPEIRPILLDLARRYHESVSTTLGITLPADGYSIQRYYTDLVMDADVGSAGGNLASVNLPLGLSYTYEPTFSNTLPGTVFDPTDHGSPFFSGIGFVGVKVLRAPAGGNAIQLFTTLSSDASTRDAADVWQLYRHLDGSLDPIQQSCNNGEPALTHICATGGVERDVKTSTSSRGGTLGPGQGTDYTVAYVFAAPYGSCAAPCDVPVGNPLRLTDPAALANGVNQLDSLAGYTGFTDLNGDGSVQGGEIRAAPRSLLAKSQMAQALFDAHFLQPAAPAAPAFFLIPGDDRTTVIWQPSITEKTGDPYFPLASTPTRINSDGQPEINPLYDPNYRQFDVMGYRIYRGRTGDPASMVQLAEFEYNGLGMEDYTGRVNPLPLCAPELGLLCNTFDSLVPGQALTRSRAVSLACRVVQIRDGDRLLLPGGAAAVLRADTVPLKAGCGENTGVPFQFVDSTARNGFTYSYSVVAFDLNSLQSGPSSMESARELRTVRPARPGSNVVSTISTSITLEGRGRALDPLGPVPSYNELTGRFSGPFPPANLWTAALPNLVSQLLNGNHEGRVRLDSIDLGQVASNLTNGRPSIAAVRYFTVSTETDSSQIAYPVEQSLNGSPNGSSLGMPAIPLIPNDSALAALYGGLANSVFLNLEAPLEPAGYTGEYSVAFGVGSDVDPANGARWFDGPSPERNEVVDHPTAGNCLDCAGNSFSNAGTLSGVTTVYQPLTRLMFDRAWRNMGLSQTGARRAADYNLYWGSNGIIDSVVDITHNVPVPFSDHAGGTWGILNTSAQGPGGYDNRPDVLTPTDWSCVEPFRSRLTQPTNVWFTCGASVPFVLSRQAELGAIAFGAGDNSGTTNPVSVRNPSNLSPQPGFALYLAGTITQFGLTALPPKGRVWSLRDYTGYLSSFPILPARPWTAVGTELVIRVQANNTLALTRNDDLRKVHPVPDPYYLRGDLAEGEGVRFINLPAKAVVRIYSASGILLRILEHQNPLNTGDTFWDLKNRSGQRVASGVYFYHIESGTARRAGRMTIVNFTN